MQTGNNEQRNRTNQGNAWGGIENFLESRAAQKNFSTGELAETMLLKSSIRNNFNTIIKYLDNIDPQQNHDVFDESFSLTVNAVIELRQAVSMLENLVDSGRQPF